MTWYEAYPCEELCWDENGQRSDEARARQACARPDLPGVRWKIGPDTYTDWLGRGPIPHGEALGIRNWNRPHEEPEDGCPGSWYRSRFCQSLQIYLPTQSGTTYMESPLVDRSAPRLIIEAVQEYKAQLARLNGYFNEVASG